MIKVMWFLKRAEALADQTKVQTDGLAAVNALESRMADLRHIEAELETVRQAHYAANDVLHSKQGWLAEAAAVIKSGRWPTIRIPQHGH